MKRKRRPKVKHGDIFTFTLEDESIILGQVVLVEGKLDCGLCFFASRFSNLEAVDTQSMTRESIFGVGATPSNTFIHPEWQIIANAPVILEPQLWPNEEFRSKGWVGSKTYTNGILRDFINAFYGLVAWNCYRAMPDLFHQILLPPLTQPHIRLRRTEVEQ